MTERKGEKLFNFLYNRDFETSNYGSPSQLDAEEGWGRLNYLNEMSDEEFDKITKNEKRKFTPTDGY